MENNNLFKPLINASFDLLQLLLDKFKYKLPTYIPYPTNDNRLYFTNELYIPIGINTNSNTHYLHIGGENAHTFISGNSGSGKSCLIRCIITYIIKHYPNVSLFLIDCKAVELAVYRNYKNTIHYQYDIDRIEDSLTHLLDITLERYNTLMKLNKVQNTTEYNPIFVAIEEVSLLNKKCWKILKKIMCISRAVSIYICITVQRIDNVNVDNTCKMLCENRICMRVSDSKNSILAIKDECASLITNVGRGFLKQNGNLIQFQSYYISLEDTIEIVNSKAKCNYSTENDNAIDKAKIDSEDVNTKPIANAKLQDESWIDDL